MKRVLFFLILIVSFTGLSAQINKFGVPIAKSYSMQVTLGAEYNWSITKDKFGAVYFGNDDNVVLRYDASKWTVIPVGTRVRAICADDNGIVYLGGPDEFGYIGPDSLGNRVYFSLADRISSAKDITSSAGTIVSGSEEFAIGEIFSLIISDSKVYYLSNRSLIVYNTIDDNIEYINVRELNFRQFTRIYSIDDKIILADNITGLFE
jgi:hypothetical protein